MYLLQLWGERLLVWKCHSFERKASPSQVLQLWEKSLLWWTSLKIWGKKFPWWTCYSYEGKQQTSHNEFIGRDTRGGLLLLGLEAAGKAYIGFLAGLGSVKWSSLVWVWWDYCGLILGARSGIGEIFFFLGPGLRLEVKPGSRYSFLELFTLQRDWWVWGLKDRWGFVGFQSRSELTLMPSRLYNKCLLWDLYKSQPPFPSSNYLLAAMG